MLGFTVVMFLAAWNLTRGQVGRAMKSVRDAEIPASTVGVNLAATKTKTFAISAGYAGVAGALYGSRSASGARGVHAHGVVRVPGRVVVGGLATIAGAVFGALFIEFVPCTRRRGRRPDRRDLRGGPIALMWLPEGAAGCRVAVRRLLAERRGKDAQEPEEPVESRLRMPVPP